MVVACIVNISLYCCAVRKLLFGENSWMRISSASTPPTRKKKERKGAVEEPDPLVIDGRQPADQAGLRGGPPEDEGLGIGAVLLAQKIGFDQSVCHKGMIRFGSSGPSLT